MLESLSVFIPSRNAVIAAAGAGSAVATHDPDPYETAWRASHSGKPLSAAIDEVINTLRVPYNIASSLIWAEMSSPSVRVPA